MKISCPWILVFVGACLMPIIGWAQDSISLGQQPLHLDGMVPEDWLVTGKVRTAEGGPVRRAMVVVQPLVPGDSRILDTNAQGEFRTEYLVMTREHGKFIAIVTAKKKGFQTAHAFVEFDDASKVWLIPVTLRKSEEDPDLLSAPDLLSGLAPKLQHLSPADGLPAKSEKDYTEGVAYLLHKHHPEQAVPLLSTVVQHNPSCLACRTMLGLTELAWGDWDDAERTLGEGVNATLADPNIARPELLVAYGTYVSWQHEPERAQPIFQEALKLAPQDALALQELGRALLPEQQFEAASDALKSALAAGAGPPARLLYVEALLGAGRSEEAAAEMNRYLDGRDVKKLPLRDRQVWASLQNRKKAVATYAKAQTPKSPDRVDDLRHPPKDLIRGLTPAQDQQPLDSILDKVGARVLELTANFPSTSSLEAIHQEILGRKGAVREEQNQKFRYLCLLPNEAWGPGFTEYRADLDGKEAQPKGLAEGYMLTMGFTSAGLIFHPTYRSGSAFRYLGQQNVDGRNTFVIAFAQIPGKARLNGKIRQGQTSMTTYSQGLAWIDADTYQIVRLHTDLLSPVPEFRLEKQAMNIDFNEVHFNHLNDGFWLPKQVTVTLDWNGRQLQNRHEYSDYKLFNVDATEKIGKPKGVAKSSGEDPASTITR